MNKKVTKWKLKCKGVLCSETSSTRIRLTLSTSNKKVECKFTTVVQSLAKDCIVSIFPLVLQHEESLWTQVKSQKATIKFFSQRQGNFSKKVAYEYKSIVEDWVGNVEKEYKFEKRNRKCFGGSPFTSWSKWIVELYENETIIKTHLCGFERRQFSNTARGLCSGLNGPLKYLLRRDTRVDWRPVQLFNISFL